MMIEKEFARQFAHAWVDAWNRHDLAAILDHYDDAFVMHSPVIAKITGEQTGRLIGKQAVRDYWTKALELNPNLKFDLEHVLSGVDTMVLMYQGHRGLSAEVFRLGVHGLVVEGWAHYG